MPQTFLTRGEHKVAAPRFPKQGELGADFPDLGIFWDLESGEHEGGSIVKVAQVG